MPISTVLVVGATGSIGRLVVEEAVRQGYRTRALVRDPAKARQLPPEAQLVVGDVTRPDTLPAAVDGVDAVVFTLGSHGGKADAERVDYGGVRNVLRALGSRTVRVALMTAIGVTNRTGAYNRSTEVHDWKRRSERLVRASGLPYTIVRPGWFDYNAPDEHRLVFLQGDTRQAGDSSDGVIARRQIAEVLVRSLGSEEALGKTFELVATTGPAPEDVDALFAVLQVDPAGAVDGVHDTANMPPAEEPQRVRDDLDAVVAQAHRDLERTSGEECDRGHRAGSDRPGDRAAGRRRQTRCAGRPAAGQRRRGGGGLGQRRLRGERRDGRRVLARGRSRACRDGHGSGRGHRTDPCRRGLAHPRRRLRRSCRSTCTARRSCSKSSATSSPGWRGRGDRVAVRAPPSAAHRRAEQRVSHDTRRGTARPPVPAPDQVTDPLHAYQIAKRGNSLRVMAEAVRWGKRGARVNTISPGIIITPLAKDELTGPRGEGYRRMIQSSAAGRAGTPDEVGTVGALLMGPDGGFITGSDILMDGGVTAAYWYGDLAEVRK